MAEERHLEKGGREKIGNLSASLIIVQGKMVEFIINEMVTGHL